MLTTFQFMDKIWSNIKTKVSQNISGEMARPNWTSLASPVPAVSFLYGHCVRFCRRCATLVTNIAIKLTFRICFFVVCCWNHKYAAVVASVYATRTYSYLPDSAFIPVGNLALNYARFPGMRPSRNIGPHCVGNWMWAFGKEMQLRYLMRL
jgi:hypothetical protein